MRKDVERAAKGSAQRRVSILKAEVSIGTVNTYFVTYTGFVINPAPVIYHFRVCIERKIAMDTVCIAGEEIAEASNRFYTPARKRTVDFLYYYNI